MKVAFILLIVGIGFSSCKKERRINKTHSKVKPVSITDTIIGSKNITDEIAGSAYRKRAKSYFIIVKSDTSDFRCIFSESNENGKTGIILDLPYEKRTITYRQIQQELKLVLPKAKNEFDFDSLNYISFGRLILSGDLAIVITQEFTREFGSTQNIKNLSYSRISEFIKKSKLGVDFNEILKPYNLIVDQVYLEKVFFTTKSELYWASNVETDSTLVPDKILDCMLSVKLKKQL